MAHMSSSADDQDVCLNKSCLAKEGNQERDREANDKGQAHLHLAWKCAATAAKATDSPLNCSVPVLSGNVQNPKSGHDF